MTTRKERNPTVVGLIGVAVIAVVTVVSLSADRINRAVTQTGYTAHFAEAGGLRPGDEVRVAGLASGKVDSLTIEDGEVVVEFSLKSDVRLGAETRADIKSATVLGRKFLQVDPEGAGRLRDGVIAKARTTTPYDVQSQLAGLTGEAKPLDTEQLASALDTVSATLEQTPPETRRALEGVRRAGEAVTKRDDELVHLLASASDVSEVLASRSDRITTLMRDGSRLFDELTQRREAIEAVLVNVNTLLTELEGIATDNDDQIGASLEELKGVTDILNDNRDNLSAMIEGLGNYVGSLGEAVNGGPWFYGYIANLVPSNLAQQTLESLADQVPSGAPAGGAR